MHALPLSSVTLVIVGLMALTLVFAGLMYGAVLRARVARAKAREKRAEREAAAAAEAAERHADLLREAGFSRIAFETQRARVQNDRSGLVRAARNVNRDGGARWPGTTLLVPEHWIPRRPLPLAPADGAVEVLASTEEAFPLSPALRGALTEARPRTEEGPRFERMVDAIETLERPAADRFVDRDLYRVTDLVLEDDHLTLEVGRSGYFRALDQAVALECEMAEAFRSDATPGGAGRGAAADFPVRDAIGDPFSLQGHAGPASVSTLVLRRAPDGTSEFWLHRRRTVGMVGGQTHVVPTGVYQPAVDVLPEIFTRDAPPWHTVLRETAEELLGLWDADTRAAPPDAYEAVPPMADLEEARRRGEARPWFVGAGLDPLSYWLELLTVLVIDAPAFDRIVGDPPRENGEGTVVGRTRPDGTFGGLPFTDAGVREALAIPDLAPAADALLRLAWEARATLV